MLTNNFQLKIFDEAGLEVASTTGYTITGDSVSITAGKVGERYEVKT